MDNVNFIQGTREKYNSNSMQDAIFFSTDTQEVLLNDKSYGGNIQNIHDSGINSVALGNKVTQVNAWKYYRDVIYNESEISTLAHIRSVGISSVVSEFQQYGIVLDPHTEDVEEFIQYLRDNSIIISNNNGNGTLDAIFGTQNTSDGSSNLITGNKLNIPQTVIRNTISGTSHDFTDTQLLTNSTIEGSSHDFKGYIASVHVEGYNNKIPGISNNANQGKIGEYYRNHIEGTENLLLQGSNIHLEGAGNIVFGSFAHVEGYGNPNKCSEIYSDLSIVGCSESSYVQSTVQDTLEELWESVIPSHSNYRISVTGGVNNHTEGFCNFNIGTSPSNPETGQQTNTLRRIPEVITSFYAQPSSHVEGVYNYNKGYASHIEGIFNRVNTSAANHVEGIYNEVNNPAEHASGYYNKSNIDNDALMDSPNNTLYSIGNGSNTTRKNAVEVMQNGDYYIQGIGGYDGTNPSSSNTVQQIFNNIGTWAIIE